MTPQYEGHLREFDTDPENKNTWFHVHKVTTPAFWGWWIMVLPDPVAAKPKTLSFHESELTIREIR